MAARNKPYDQFGPFILFKKLDADSLGELWRAGRIAGSSLGNTVAIRRITGGHREALGNAALVAQPIVKQLSGTSFAREQEIGVVGGVPYIAHDYAGGRSLRHIIERARGTGGGTPNPLPIDQAIVIAEKVALSLTTMHDLRDGAGNRLVHGALIPHFIWISDDGEIRVAGQQLGSGLVASLADPKVAADIGRYFSSEYRATGTPSKASEVFAMGAILFLLVTGQEPPDSSTASAFMSVVRAAKTMAGTPVPDDIRVILDKSFNLDPSMRYASIADMKQAISALAHGGKYSASTFNLAFYLSNLLKKEMEGEALDREKESKVNVAPYLEAPSRPAATVPIAAASAAPMFAGVEETSKTRSKVPLFAVAALVVAAVAVGGFVMMRNNSAAPASATTQAAAIPVPAPKPAVPISEPLVAVTDSSTTNIPLTSTDPDAQKKAFEDAVKARMQAEMMKLQDEFTRKLKQQQSKNAPVEAPAPAPVQAAEDRSVSAAELDAQRREAAAEKTQQTASVAPQVVPPPVTTQTQAPAPQPVVPAPQVAAVREGDVVDILQLDVRPRVLRAPKPQYTPVAARQKVAGEIVVTALISENGDVIDVKVLRGLGAKGYGLDDAAVRAMRNFKFSPGTKGGVRVRTWWPQTMVFKPE
jgi:TonB family protein